MRTPRKLVVAFVLLFSLQLEACASLFSKGTGKDATAAVTVANHNFNDMDVFAVRVGGLPLRLGMVTTGSSVTFRLPRDVTAAGMVRIVALPIGADVEGVTSTP